MPPEKQDQRPWGFVGLRGTGGHGVGAAGRGLVLTLTEYPPINFSSTTICTDTMICG
jgi:hypothetical protein